MTPRAITGLGVVSTLGVGREAFFAGLDAPTLLRDRKPTAVETLDAVKYPNVAPPPRKPIPTTMFEAIRIALSKL